MVIRKLEKNEIDSLLELYKHYTSEENVPELTEKTKIEIWEAITQNPCVNIQLGRQHFKATAERLSTDEAEKIFRLYHQRHPNAIKNLSKMIGYQVDEDEESLTQFMRSIPVIAFHPED